MQVHYKKLRNFVYATKFELPYDVDTITAELQNETWIPIHPIGRHAVHKPKSGILKEVIDELRHPEGWRRQFIELLYSTDEYPHLWMSNKEMLHKITSTSVTFYKDTPGFKILTHLDRRDIIAVGMCFLTNSISQSTCFFSTSQHHDPMPINAIPSSGWCAANTHDSWHLGSNDDTHDRLSIYLDIHLNLNS